MLETGIIIIGAGAAGIGAGLELAERGQPFVILEAANRLGGRAYTDTTSLPRAWDQGCHWMHCANKNPLVAWADRLGADYERQPREDYFRLWRDGAFLNRQEVDEAEAIMDAAFNALDQHGVDGPDVAITDVLPDMGRWRKGLEMLLALQMGDDPHRVSTVGYADYAETETDWPVLSGYGDLIARMANSLPVRLGVRAERISEAAGGVQVETDNGTLRGQAVIVTASTNVLTSGAIRFGPGPAADLLDDIAQVPCGQYEKIAIALRALPGEVADKLFLDVYGDDDDPVVDFQIMAGDPPLMIAHVAGDDVRALTAAGTAAMKDLATERLTAVFGSDIRSDIIDVATTAWGSNPLIQGSYSHATPGAGKLRHQMIEADTGRIAFAGEAFSLQWQATAHGAYLTGRHAAARMCERHLKTG